MRTIRDFKEEYMEPLKIQLNGYNSHISAEEHKEIQTIEVRLKILERILDFKKRGITKLNSFKRLIKPEDLGHLPKLMIDVYNEDLTDEQLLYLFNELMPVYDDFLKENGNGSYTITIEDDYHIECADLFYESEINFTKQEIRFKSFLLESEKVAVDPNLVLIPFQIKNEFYYIMVDNLSKNLFLSDDEAGFRYINKQSNLYDMIQSVRKEELNNNLNYKGYLLEELRKSTASNKVLLRKIYDKPNKLLTNKHVIQRFTEKYKLRNNV